MKITIVVMDHQKNSKKKGENPKISVKNKGKIHKNGENRNFGACEFGILYLGFLTNYHFFLIYLFCYTIHYKKILSKLRWAFFFCFLKLEF